MTGRSRTAATIFTPPEVTVRERRLLAGFRQA